jgi:fructose-bisphosphate aldolase, class II
MIQASISRELAELYQADQADRQSLQPLTREQLDAGSQGIHFDRMKAIQERFPGFPLVMHGSSSVPSEEVARINAAGGQMKGAAGVDPHQYLPAAKLGVCKVNIDTDGRLVWTRFHREYFRDKPGDFDFRGPGKIFMAEYAKFIAGRNELLGSAHQLDAVRAHLAK